MAGRDVVPLPLGGEMGEDGGVEPAHPVVRVRRGARRAPRARAAPAARAGGRTASSRAAPYSRRRWPRPRSRAGRRLLARSLGAAAGPATAADDGKVTFTVGLTSEVDSFNPFLGIEAELLRDVGADLRLHDRATR